VFNPAAHMRWNASDNVAVRLSAAQTLRRPTFAELNPALTINGDHSVLGDPELEPERALGFDAGVDLTRAADAGILGLNAFYRRIDDKIELLRAADDLNAALQTYVDEDIEALRYASNPNTGVVYGAELDVSYPLTAFGAPNLHVFANYTHMRSRIRDASDPAVERPFNLLPDYHYNVGFDHLIERFGFTWGASYQKRGAAQEWSLDGVGAREVADVTFGGNLEAFIEKTFAQRFVVRLAAQNLRDADRIDTTRVYESAEQYRGRTPVSVERDREESDPHVILTFRGTF
jgi:outer membrane receptor for ferrienterochelin and colicins